MGRRESGISNKGALWDTTVPGKQRAAEAVANDNDYLIVSWTRHNALFPDRGGCQTNTDPAYDLDDPAKPGEDPVLDGHSPAEGAV